MQTKVRQRLDQICAACTTWAAQVGKAMQTFQWAVWSQLAGWLIDRETHGHIQSWMGLG
jgi:hypothetical protein